MKVNFIDAGTIMSVVVTLIILAVGVFAFFVTLQSIPITNTETEETVQGITDTRNSVFNIIGVVLVIGAVMSVVGLVYSFIGRIDDHDDESTYSVLSQKKLDESLKVKSRSKTKKKNFEWGV